MLNDPAEWEGPTEFEFDPQCNIVEESNSRIRDQDKDKDRDRNGRNRDGC